MVENILQYAGEILLAIAVIILAVQTSRIGKNVEVVHSDAFEAIFRAQSLQYKIEHLEERVDNFIEASQKKPATRKPAARKPAVKKEAK